MIQIFRPQIDCENCQYKQQRTLASPSIYAPVYGGAHRSKRLKSVCNPRRRLVALFPPSPHDGLSRSGARGNLLELSRSVRRVKDTLDSKTLKYTSHPTPNHPDSGLLNGRSRTLAPLASLCARDGRRDRRAFYYINKRRNAGVDYFPPPPPPQPPNRYINHHQMQSTRAGRPPPPTQLPKASIKNSCERIE